MVSRRSMASSASGNFVEAELPPDHRADAPGAQELEELSLCGLALGSGRPVETERPRVPIGSLTYTRQTPQRSKLPYTIGRRRKRTVLELNVLTEAGDQVRPFMPMHLKVCSVTVRRRCRTRRRHPART